MMLEPAASIAESRGYRIVTSFPSLWGDFAFTGLTSTQSQVNRSPDMVRAMKTAMQEALNLAHSNPAQAIAIAQRLFPSISETVSKVAVERMLHDETIPKSFLVSQQGWNAAITVRQEMGELRTGVNYDNVVVR
jgi:NitT/TauT family transport system substrate-binding protein